MEERVPASTPCASNATVASLPAPRVRTFVLLGITLAASIFLTGWIGTKEEELLPGRLSAHTTIIRTPVAGRIDKWLIDSQTTVQQGTKLAILVDGSLQQQIAEKRRQVASLETALKRSKAQADIDLAWRLRSLESEILANRLEAAELIRLEYDQRIEQHAWKSVLRRTPVAAASSRRTQRGLPASRRLEAAATDSLSPDDVFRPAGFTISPSPTISSRQRAIKGHENARNAAEVTAVKLHLREERLRDLQRLIEELPAKVRQAAGIEAANQRLAAAKAALKELEARPQQQTIHSDAYGKLLSRNGNTGDVLKAGDVLVRIVDDERRHLTVPVPANRLSRFEVGNEVSLQFPGNERRRGRIVEMETATSDATLHIEPAGKLWPAVPIGSAVQVVVPTE